MELSVQRRPEQMDLILEECLREAGPDLAARSLAVTHQVGQDIPPYSLDRLLIKEVLGRLLQEAIHTANEAGRLRVTLRANRHALMVAIKASGGGLSDVQREILFTGEPNPGTLARVRSIVAAHGGVTWANGKPGKGTTYYVSLPLAGTASREHA